MISVYRIYFGCSWEASGMAGDLVKLFDRVPEFLYSRSALPQTGPEGAMMDAADREAAVKIAMAQCHVAVIWGGIADPSADWTEDEIRVARSIFRCRIPVLAVIPDGFEKSAGLAQLADRTVGWSTADATRAVVELSEIAAENRHLGRGGTGASATRPAAVARPSAPRHAVGDHGERRSLPIAEIVAAFRRLQSSRDDGAEMPNST